RSGDFIDLCAGPHVKSTGDIGAFRLTTVASAYYKGDEKNPQLQRVYGTAFKTKKDLDDYFAMLEEAKMRDHRKLGKELELFVFDDDVGPGLPMFLPRGAVIAEELEKLAKETEFAAGYQRVRTPHITRESLYKKSGHLPYYADSMFPPMEIQEEHFDHVMQPWVDKNELYNTKELRKILIDRFGEVGALDWAFTLWQSRNPSDALAEFDEKTRHAILRLMGSDLDRRLLWSKGDKYYLK